MYSPAAVLGQPSWTHALHDFGINHSTASLGVASSRVTNRLAAQRIGEANNPGPEAGFDDPEAMPCEPWDEPEEPCQDDPPDELDHSPGEFGEGWDSDCSTADTEPTDYQACSGEIVPGWRAWLSDEGNNAWSQAESMFGIDHSRSRPPKSTTTNAGASHATPPARDSTDDLFRASDCYKGHLDSFVFTTRDGKTGYYRDTQPSQPPVVISLSSLLATDTDGKPDSTAQKEKRQPKSKEHRKRKSRRWLSLRAKGADTAAAMHSDAANIAHRVPGECGMWTLDTCNAGGWRGTAGVLTRNSADIVVAQEIKIRADARLHSTSRQMWRKGWSTHIQPSLATAANGSSGGTAVATKRGVGMTSHTIADDYLHRIASTWIAGVAKGGIHVVSVYLKDMEGIGGTNTAVLEQLAAHVKTLRGPWVIGGDWNLEPKALRDAGWLDMIGGAVAAPDAPTCNGKVYDFWIVKKSFEHAVAGVR